MSFCTGFFIITLGALFVLSCSQNSAQDPALWSSSPGIEDSFLFTYPYEDASSEERNRARDRIVSLIRSARSRIELWCYGFDESGMIEALAEAQARGVQIRIIGSPDQNYEGLTQAGLRYELRRRSGIQHVKLMLIDDRLLVSGTGNFTRSGFFYNHNAFFILPIERHEAEAVRSGLLSEGKTKRRIILSRWGLQLLISPADGRYIQSRLLSAVLGAQRSIRFLIFSHSDPVLTDALKTRAQEGLLVEGIFSDNNNDGLIDTNPQNTMPEAQILNESLGLSLSKIYLEGNRRVFRRRAKDGSLTYHGGKLHHKTLLVDSERIFTGSYNWSLAARDRNLEVVFLIQNKKIAETFEKEFERIRRNALLLGRPPFPPGFLLRPEFSLSQASGQTRQLCVSGLNSAFAHRLTLFRGSGLCLGAGLYQFDVGQSCIPETKISKASAGPLQTQDYRLDPLSLSSITAAGFALTPGPSRRGAPAKVEAICEPARLSALPIRSYTKTESVLWLDRAPEEGMAQLRLWTRHGLSDWMPASLRTADVVELPGKDASNPAQAPKNYYAGGDAVIFFRAGPGSRQIYVSCLQSGSELNGNLGFFQRSLLQESGTYLSCLRIK